MASNFSITNAGTALFYDLDANKPDAKINIVTSDSTVTEMSNNRIVLATTDADISVPFGGITDAKKVVVTSDKKITVKINGSGNVAIPVTGCFVADSTAGGITSVHISNADTSVADVRVLIVG